jgi:hypothetical protein
MKNRFNVPLVRLFGIIAFVVVIEFSMTVLGCDDGSKDDGGGGGGGSIPETNVQVYNKDGTPYTGSGTVKYTESASGSYKTIEVGVVTDGKLTLTLPPTSAMSGFSAGSLIHDYLSLYPGTSSSSIDLRYDGQSGNKSYHVGYSYQNTAYKLNSTNYYGVTYQLDYQPGWIKILTIREQSKPLICTNKLSGMPSSMKWTLDN